MKKTFLLLIITASFMSLKAQVFIGGGLNFNTTNLKYTDNTTTEDGDKTISFNFYPKVGYFLNDKFAIGLGFGIGSTKTTTPKTDYEDERVVKTKNWSVSPFARYYFTKINNFSVFGEGTLGFGGGSSSTKTGTTTNDGPKYFSVNINIAPAVSYNFSDNFSIETSLGGIGYSSQKATYDKGTETEYSGTSAGINVSFGFDNLTFGAIYKF
jgi:hypothetical protein